MLYYDYFDKKKTIAIFACTLRNTLLEVFGVSGRCKKKKKILTAVFYSYYYLCFISLLYLDLYLLGDDALIA